MTQRSITGFVKYPDGSIPPNSRVEFVLLGNRVNDAVYVTNPVYTNVSSTGFIDVSLEPNEGGYGAERYSVDLVTYRDSEFVKEIRRVHLGKIYVEDFSGQTIEDLLAFEMSAPEGVGAAQAAAADAAASAALLDAVVRGRVYNTVTVAGQTDYVLSFDPGQAHYLNVFLNGKLQVAEIDYTLVYVSGNPVVRFSAAPDFSGQTISYSGVTVFPYDPNLNRLESFASRAELVTHIAANGAIDGQSYFDGQVSYRGQTGATVIPDLPGLVPINATFEHYGAVGDGVADDAAALNAAVTGSPETSGKPGAIYKFGSTFTVPNNCTVWFNGSRLRRGFYGDWVIQTVNAKTTWDANNITLHDLWIDDDGTLATRGNGALLVGDNITVTRYRNGFTAPGDGVMGAWAMYVSGDDCNIDVERIDNSACGLFGDGVHVGYFKNLTINARVIKAGDDAVALFAPRKSFAFGGKNLASQNASIRVGLAESADANGFRLGNWGAASGVADPRENFVMSNVRVDMTFGDCKTNCLQVFDDRHGAEIVGKHTDIFITARASSDATLTRLINIAGNANIELAENLSQKNFGRVEVDMRGVHANNTTGGNLIRAGGADHLTLSGDLRVLGAPVAPSHVTLFGVTEVVLRGLTTQGGTTGTFLSSKWVERLFVNDLNHMADGTSEFQTIVMVLTSDLPSSLYMSGGRIAETSRGVRVSGTGRVKDFIVQGTRLEESGAFPASSSFSTVTWESGGIFAFDPAAGMVCTVANLPGSGVPVKLGHRAYASNGRKVGEGAGSGTGVPVYRSADGTWRTQSADAVVAA